MQAKLFAQVHTQLESAKQDIDLARQRCTTSHGLLGRITTNAVQVGRAFVKAVEGGIRLPGEEWASLTFPRPLTDEHALKLWAMFIAPNIRHTFPDRLKGGSGKSDFPPVVRNKAGKLIGKDGKPLRYVKTKYTGPNGEVVYGEQLSGELVLKTDLMDEPDRLDRAEHIAADWADLIGLLIELVDDQQPTKPRRSTRRCSGRDEQFVAWADAELSAKEIAAKWNALNPTDNVSDRVVQKAIERKSDI